MHSVTRSVLSCALLVVLTASSPSRVGAQIGVLRDGIVGTEVSASQALAGDATPGPFCGGFLQMECFAISGILTVPDGKDLVITHFDGRDDGQALAPTFLTWGASTQSEAVGVLDLSFFPLPDKRISPGILVQSGSVGCANALSPISCFVAGILVDEVPSIGINRQGVVGELVSAARVFTTETAPLYTVPGGKTLLITHTIGDSAIVSAAGSVLTSGAIDPGTSAGPGFLLTCVGFASPPPEFPNSCAFSGILVDVGALSLENGDTNGDVSVTELDAGRLRRGLTQELALGAPIGDVDLDGSLTVVDVVVLRRILAGSYVATS